MQRIVLAVALFVGCSAAPAVPERGSTPEAGASAPFKIAFNTWLGYSPLVIAQEKGFLTESGIDVEIVMMEGIGEKNAALIRGDLDGVGHTADSAVTSAASGVDGKIVFVFDRSFGADGVLARDTIRSVADLKGKRIALEPGFTGHFFLLAILSEIGLGPSDVDIVPMDTGTAGSAFIAGAVDAAVTWEPWIGKSKERGDAHILITTKDKPGLVIDVLYMRSRTIEDRPADVQKLILAMGKATDWYYAHVDEGDEIIARFWKMSLQEEKETVSGMQFMTLYENFEFFGTDDSPGKLSSTILQASALWLQAGVTKSLVEAKQVIEYTSLKSVARQHRAAGKGPKE